MNEKEIQELKNTDYIAEAVDVYSIKVLMEYISCEELIKREIIESKGSEEWAKEALKIIRQQRKVAV